MRHAVTGVVLPDVIVLAGMLYALTWLIAGVIVTDDLDDVASDDP